jgi:ISXO2-like transposase domain/Transposase zinc-ribbon domain
MEYPKDYRDLIKRFGTQDACIDYIASIRWKDGFTCSSCGGHDFWRLKRLSWTCSKCETESRVLAGTLFQDTKLPLTLWFQMIWWFMGQKNGASALSLQQNFGIGSYRTSWSTLKKLRLCTVLPTRSQLTGDVEVDQAFLGGVNGKEIILIAAEKRGAGSGRIRLKHAKSETAKEVQGFILDVVELGSNIISDRHKSYPTIVEKGYTREAMKKPYSWENVDGDDDRLLPRVGRVAAHMKRWYLGTYHGGMKITEVQPYLDEFVFRYNRRTSKSRGLVFHRMVEAAVKSKPLV